MKKYILILVIVLLAIVAFISISRRNSTLREKDTHFAVNAPESITKIKIEAKDKSVVLEQINNKWKVNDEEANAKRIHDMLVISELIEAVAPASNSQADSIAKRLDEGMQISYYNMNKCTNSYRICKWNNMQFARNKRSGKPFRIAVKGYPYLDLTKVFSQAPGDWALNMLINLSSDQIQQVEVLYPDNPKKSYVLTNAGRVGYRLLGNGNKDLTGKIDQKTALEYCNFFSGVRYIPLPDSLKKDTSIVSNHQPYFFLNVTVSGAKPIRIEGFQKTDKEKGTVDRFRFYAVSSEKGIIMLNYSDLDPILVSPDYFLKK
jgi:hypothetical protein